MVDKKFAFELEGVSIAFTVRAGMGDTITAKKVLTAVIELATNFHVDLFYDRRRHKEYATAFYSDIKNLNLLLPRDDSFKEIYQKYDLVFFIAGAWAVHLEHVNDQRLQELEPELFQAISKVKQYNLINLRRVGHSTAVCLRYYAMSRILDKDCYAMLSCDGALPIRDNKVNIPLLPEYQSEFDKLNLGNYITTYSDIGVNEERPKIKTWPMHHLVEFVDLMKQRFPAVKIIQCGGGGDAKIENVDRDFLGCGLELTKYILTNSLLNVGGEGGLVHLATALGTKCLVLFGFSPVEYVGYKRNINLISDVCFPCESIWEGGMARTCKIDEKKPPCMWNHTPQKVCEVTCNYLNSLGLKNDI